MSRKNKALLCLSAAIVIAGGSCSGPFTSVNDVQNPVVVPTVGIGTDVISTDWLYSTLENSNSKIIDVRSPEEFSLGHIPHSINIPFDIISVWAQSDFGPNGLWLELPEISDLETNLGAYGISSDSKVVLVTGLPTTDNPYAFAAPTRVALILAYTGVNDVAILDGSYEKWYDEGKPVTTEAIDVSPVAFNNHDATDYFVDIDFVERKLGKVTLIDARDADVYAGNAIEPFADQPGHISTAVSLPAPMVWNSDGTYKSKTEIQAIADAVIVDSQKDIVIYCGVGGYASTVWFALTKILDYKNVKVFDGSAQEWVQNHNLVVD